MDVRQIKFWRDGDRFVIVVDNCTGETATKVNRFIIDMLGLPQAAVVEPKILPAVVPTETVPINTDLCEVLEDATEITTSEDLFKEPTLEAEARNIVVAGGAGTLGHAIETKDTATIVKTCAESKDPQVTKLCKSYIYTDCLRRDYEFATDAEIRTFYKDYEPLISAAITQILDSAGYASLDEYMDFASERLVRDAYRAIIESILEKSQ